MGNRILEGQSRFFELYADLMQTSNAAIAATLQNTERLQRAQIALLANYLAEQSELAKLQASQGMEMWRLFLSGVRETREAPAEEQVERMQDEVERAAEALMQARDEALRVAAMNATGLMQDASESALAAVRQPAWSGPERRTALATAYAGVERRRAA
jgi:hypothetical protein